MHYTTYSTGPVSSTRTVRTTHTTTGGGLLGGTAGFGIGVPTTIGGAPTLLGTTLMPAGHTRVVQTSQPIMTQTRYVNTTGAPSMVYQSGPVMMGSGLTRLGSISLRPLTTYSTTMAAAPVTMGIAPMMHMTQASAATATQQATYTNSASLTINGLLCEGYIACSNDQIIQAKNLFVGVAPFHLGTDTLEVTPDYTVVTRNPDIIYHLADLPNESCQALTLAELRSLAQIPADKPVYVGLPGQAACQATAGPDGSIMIQQTDARVGKLVGASLF